jgi:SMC interacting uncharacterized protein involved in chromosome segregation
MSLDKIYKMLESNNVELKSEKIELTAVSDMEAITKDVLKISSDKSIVKKAEKLESNLNQAFQDLDNLQKDYSNQRKIADTKVSELNKAFTKLNKQAKELGVSVTDLPIYKDYLKAQDAVKEYSREAQDAWNKVYKFKK